ncbi:MAG: polysaccharide deacetylase WbmS family protein [Solirubrobacteraceae bacterium]
MTLDVDWAPDFAIDFVAERLVAQGVRATWFVTHRSAAIDRLVERGDLFELGIHPNFASGSSHGATAEAVLEHSLKLVPQARAMRTHSLIQSSRLLDLVLTRTNITSDLSIFLPGAAHLGPVEYTLHGRTLFRLPYFWEDDYEFGQSHPCWTMQEHLTEQRGLRIFNFHPIHVYLNSVQPAPYAELKRVAGHIGSVPEAAAAAFVHDGPGTRSLFDELTAHLAARGGGYRITDITFAGGSR